VFVGLNCVAISSYVIKDPFVVGHHIPLNPHLYFLIQSLRHETLDFQQRLVRYLHQYLRSIFAMTLDVLVGLLKATNFW